MELPHAWIPAKEELQMPQEKWQSLLRPSTPLLSCLPNPPPSSDIKALGIKITDLMLTVVPGVIYLNPAFPGWQPFPAVGAGISQQWEEPEPLLCLPGSTNTAFFHLRREKPLMINDISGFSEIMGCKYSRIRIPELPRAVGWGQMQLPDVHSMAEGVNNPLPATSSSQLRV